MRLENNETISDLSLQMEEKTLFYLAGKIRNLRFPHHQIQSPNIEDDCHHQPNFSVGQMDMTTRFSPMVHGQPRIMKIHGPNERSIDMVDSICKIKAKL